VPSGQGSQRLTLATDPCGHWAQAAEPCAETLPGAHLAHWARAGLDEKVPSWQTSQRLTFATEPWAQGPQAAEPWGETLPGAHLAHAVSAGLDEKVPSWQGSQRDRLLAGVDTAPPGHCWHSSLERTETDPGGQAEQADFFEEGL